MAKVYLDKDEQRNVYNSNDTIIGNTGTERLVFNAGSTNVKLDANVERIDVVGNLNSYTFKTVAGTGLQILSGTTVVATIPNLNQDTTVAFADGSAVLKQTGATAYTLGGQAISTTDVVLTPAVLGSNFNTTVKSGSGSTNDGSTGGAASGQTFTLTTSVDNLTGTSGNDTFVATATATAAAGTPFANTSTLNTADKLVGGAGVDALNIVVDGAENSGPVAYSLPAADVSGIEVINVRNVATAGTDTLTINANLLVGATEFYSDRSTTDMAFTNVAAGSTVGFKGNGTNAATGNVTAGYVAGATAANVSLQGGHSTTAGANTATLSVNGAALTSATITASGGGTNTINGVAFGGGSAVNALTVDAQSNIATGNITGLAANTKITVKGAGTANIGTLLATNVTEVDASANTGGVTATLNGVTTFKFTGGSGNDVVTTGATLAGAGLVDAGAGTADRLAVATTADIDANSGKLYKNFEQLQANDGVTVNLSHLATTNTIDTIRINDGAGATGTGVTNLSAAQAANVSIVAANATGAITIGVKDATNPGQMDVVKAALTTTDATGAAQAINLTGIVLTGVETLELTGNGTVKGTTGAVTLTTTAAADLSVIKLANAGDGNSINVNSVTAANLSVDASGSTGTVTITANGYNTTTGASLKGGQGNDSIYGSTKTDVIEGGAGNDTIIGDAAAEVQTITLAGTAGANYTVTIGGQAVTIASGDTAVSAAAKVTAALTALTDVASVADGGTATVTVTWNASAGNKAALAIDSGTPDTTTFTFATTTQGGANSAGDILTGGAGKDNFVISTGAGNTIANIDWIKDLDLGTATVTGQVDKLTLSGTIAVAKVTLTDAQQSAVTAAADLTTAVNLLLNGGALSAGGSAATFTYGTDTYLLYSGNATTNNDYQAASDVLVKITGVSGTFDASDITLVS